MPDVRVLRFADLTPGDLACWDAWQRAEPELDSPCFRPEFTAIASEVLGNVEVALVRVGDQLQAIFPFHRSSWKVAQPVIRGMNDFHGLIKPAGVQIDMPQLLQDCGLVAADFHSVPVSQTDIVQPDWLRHPSHYLNLAGGFADYCQRRKWAGSETVEKTLRKIRRFAREQNSRFELRAEPEMLLLMLMQWKNHHHADLGVLTPIQSPRSESLLKRYLEANSERFEAFVSVLWGNELPAAIAYVLRSGPTAHCWFVGYDERFSKWSPGISLLLQVGQALADEGVTRFHLGKGNERFKSSLADGQVTVAEGMLGTPSLALSWLQAWQRTKHWVKRSPLSVGVRMLRPLRQWLAYGQR